MANPKLLADVTVDEIALEGMDGLTIESLWIRLADRLKWPLPLHTKVRTSIWHFVRRSPALLFYELAEPRQPLRTFDRIDFDTQTAVAGAEYPFTVYAFREVDDPMLRGSCQDYDTRRPIDAAAELYDQSLDQIAVRWPDRLVVAGTQNARESVLFPSTVSVQTPLTLHQYCLLERIGRSRWNGEATCGRFPLNEYNQFHLRKPMIRSRLLAKQLYYEKVKDHNTQGLLLHLPRFYRIFKPKAMLIVEQVVEMLRQAPDCRIEYTLLLANFEDDLLQAVRKAFKSPMLHTFVRTDVRLPYRTLWPNAKVDEWRSKSSQTERMVRCCELRNAQLDVGNMWTQTSATEAADDDGGGSDTENGGLFDQSQLDLNEPLLRQAYKLLDEAGCTGLSQKLLAKCLGLPKLNVRMVVRNLSRMGLTDSYLKDAGRQRTTIFILKRYSEQQRAKMADDLAMSTTVMPAGDEDVAQQLPCDTNQNLADDLERTLAAAVEDATDTSSAAAAATASASAVDHAVKLEPVDGSAAELPISAVQLELRELDRLPSDKLRRHTANFMTARLCKRLQIIDQALRRHHVIDDVYKLYHTIHKVERHLGYKDEMCRRSIKRLVSQLCEERKVRLWMVRVTFKTVCAVHMYISEPTVDAASPVMQRQLDKEKVKFLLRLNTERARLRVVVPDRAEPAVKQLAPVSAATPLPPAVAAKAKCQPLTSPAAAGGPKAATVFSYGNIPKFIRMRTLHEFLFYLVYAQPADQPTVAVEAAIRGWRQQQPTVDYAELRAEMSQAYSAELNWRTFVPPLQRHGSAAAADAATAAAENADNPYTDGWLLLSDALLRMPLSVFVNVQNLNYEVPGLEQILQHPVRKHYLLSFLPGELQDALLSSRKYLFAVSDVLRRCCSLGLLQLGPQRAYSKEHVYVYVNRNAGLVDTIASEPRYYQTSVADYPRSAYHFDSVARVDSYWHDLHRICTSTRLNRRNASSADDDEANGHGGPTLWDTAPAMVATWQMRTADEVSALDRGEIPGDGRGAGGLDSTLFAHLHRNWAFGRRRREPKRLQATKRRGPAVMTNMQQKQRLGSRGRQTTTRRLAVVSATATAATTATTSKPGTTGTAGKSAKPSATGVKVKHVRKLVIRVRRPRNTTATAAATRQPLYDEVDQQALRRMVKLRVDWSREEDNFLLLTRAAHLILCPNYRRLNVSSAHVRDLLHWHCQSLNKTSRACQRRIVYMLKHPAKAAQFHLSVQEARELPEVRRRFGRDFYSALRRQLPGEANFVAALKIFYVELVHLLLHNVHRLTAMSSMATGNSGRALPHGFRHRRASCGGSAGGDGDGGGSWAPVRSILPDTVAAFRELFDCSPEEYEHQRLRFAQPRTVRDIEVVAIGQLIHSSCCCTLDKTSWNIQLYDIYKTYAESVLADAMAKMRDEQLISANKLSVPSRQTTRSLPLNSTPYHLSQRYNLMMLTALPVDLLEDAWSARQSLVADARLERFRVRRINGGYCLLLAELLHRWAAGGGLECSIEIPSPIIVFDSSHCTVSKSNLERIKSRYSSIFDFVGNENAYKLTAAEVATAGATAAAPTPGASMDELLRMQQQLIAAEQAVGRLQHMDGSVYHFFCVLNAMGSHVARDRLQIGADNVCSLPSCVHRQPANAVAAACTEISQRPGMVERLLEIKSMPSAPGLQLDDDEFTIDASNVAAVFAVLVGETIGVDRHGLTQIAIDIGNAKATLTTPLADRSGARPPHQPRVRTVTISELEHRTHEYHLGAIERLMKMDDSMLHFFCVLDAIGTRTARARLHFDTDLRCPLPRCVQRTEHPVATAVEICNRPGMANQLTAIGAGDTATVAARLGDGEFEICVQNVLAVFTVLVNRQPAVSTGATAAAAHDTIQAHGMPQLGLDIINERQLKLDLNVDEVVVVAPPPPPAAAAATPADQPPIAPPAVDEKGTADKNDDGEEDGDRVSKLHDYFFLNSTIVSLSIGDTGLLCPDERAKHELLDSLCAEHIWPPVAREPSPTLATDDDAGRLAVAVLDHLVQRNELGVAASALVAHFGAHTPEALAGALQRLERDQLVLRTGVTEYVYVQARFAKPWLIATYNLKRLQRETMVPSAAQLLRLDGTAESGDDSSGSGDTGVTGTAKKRKLSSGAGDSTDEPGRVGRKTRQTRKSKKTVTLAGELPAECRTPAAAAAADDDEQRPLMLLHMKPWLRVNGSLNRRCLDRWLATVLMHCVSNAGVTLDQLARRFYLLLPVHVRDLLGYMRRLQWVRLVALRRAPVQQPAFFWEAYAMPQEVPATDLDAMDTVHVEVEPDAISKLIAFIGDKKYSAEFI